MLIIMLSGANYSIAGSHPFLLLTVVVWELGVGTATDASQTTFSLPATIDICHVFGSKLCDRMVGVGPRAFTEMNAAGDTPLESLERLVWKVQSETPPPWTPPPSVPSPGSTMLVTVAPADTRTFRLVLG
jgi:hypothetical protein